MAGISGAAFTEALNVRERLVRLELQMGLVGTAVDQRVPPLEADLQQRRAALTEEQRQARIKELEAELADMKKPPVVMVPLAEPEG